MCGFLVDSYSNVFFVKFCWFGSSWFVIKLQIQFTEKKSLVPNQSHWVSTQKLRVLQFSWSTTAQKINMLHLKITQLERKIIFASLHCGVQKWWIFQGARLQELWYQHLRRWSSPRKHTWGQGNPGAGCRKCKNIGRVEEFIQDVPVHIAVYNTTTQNEWSTTHIVCSH